MLLNNAQDIIASSYFKLGDLTLARMRNYENGYDKSQKQKQLYEQSNQIILNLQSVFDHVSYDDNGDLQYTLRSTDEQINRFLRTLETVSEIDEYATAPTLFHKVKPRLINVGLVGNNGLNANVLIGTVTTAAPGTPAQVTNSGSAQVVILNFVIPTGKPPLMRLSGSMIQYSVDEGSTWLDLVPLSAITAPNVQFQYSTDGSSWHGMPGLGDVYFRTSSDGGSTWSDKVLFVDASFSVVSDFGGSF